jgi:alkanesulfonate monooxygenase SsuD/methylene tetrahydromethanopterin reductase-like flavin-dependent oxidoreductase (luciferase family)
MGLPVLGLTLPQFNERPGPALEASRDAWTLGFGGVFVFDHLWPLGQPQRPALEGWTLLAALAAHVGRQPEGFRVGTLVTRAGLRNPGLVARMAATVAEIAGGPPIIGIGRGDAANRDENQAFGLPFGDPAERTAALEATVAALRGPLAGSRSTGAPPWGSPDPSGPEVWVGGTGPSALALAGRLGDAWNGWGRTPEELAAGLAEARRAAEAAGRHPAAVAGTWAGQVLVAADGREAEERLATWGADRPPAEVARVLAGGPGAVVARLRALADAGASWCVLAPVGGPGAEARALLAAAAGLPGRTGNS